MMNLSFTPGEESIDVIDVEELKFALTLRQAALTGRLAADGSGQWFDAQDQEFCFPDTPDNRFALSMLGHCRSDRAKFFALMIRIEHLLSLLASAHERGWASIQSDGVAVHEAVIEAACSAPMHVTRGPDEERFFDVVEMLARRNGAERQRPLPSE